MITTTVFPGTAFQPVLLAVVEVNGTPVFVPVSIAQFDTKCSWQLFLPVPSGLVGLEFSLQAFGVAASGRTRATPKSVLKITN